MSPKTYGFPQSAFDPSTLPDINHEFISDADIKAFDKALNAPKSSPVVALNDWRPIHQRVQRIKPKSPKRRKKKPLRRNRDETREGFVYVLLKWPLTFVILGWIVALGLSYLVTRLYIWGYERLVTWRGTRQRLRKQLRLQTNYEDWKTAAEELDRHLGNEKWRETDDYAYYDYGTVTRVTEQLRKERTKSQGEPSLREAIEKLRSLVEACVKNNFVGIENPALYSETYFGTKKLAQSFVDELYNSLAYLLRSSKLNQMESYELSEHLHTNFGRSALCLSGGASFAW